MIYGNREVITGSELTILMWQMWLEFQPFREDFHRFLDTLFVQANEISDLLHGFLAGRGQQVHVSGVLVKNKLLVSLQLNARFSDSLTRINQGYQLIQLQRKHFDSKFHPRGFASMKANLDPPCH